MTNTEKVLEKLSGTIEENGALPVVSDYETLEAAILKYGADSQIDRAIEEMAELTKALLKERRYYKAGKRFECLETENLLIIENIAEEMAVVVIMLIQLQMMYNNKEQVTQYIIDKVERLKNRMKGGESNEQ